MCPVPAMQYYLVGKERLPVPPLFAFHDGWHRASDITLRLLLVGSLTLIHSSRIGSTTAAMVAGAPVWLKQTNGRWRSEAYQQSIQPDADKRGQLSSWQGSNIAGMANKRPLFNIAGIANERPQFNIAGMANERSQFNIAGMTDERSQFCIVFNAVHPHTHMHAHVHVHRCIQHALSFNANIGWPPLHITLPLFLFGNGTVGKTHAFAL